MKLRSAIFELLYRLGSRWRNPHLESSYRFLLETDRWTRERLDAHQLERCRGFLTFAGRHSAYYRDLFSEIGFEPTALASIEDLRRIPPVDKQVLIRENARIRSRHSFPRLHECATSGTSGAVLKFPRDEEWDSAMRAAERRGYAWHGVEPWERNGYFWGFQIEGWKRVQTRVLDALQNRFRLFSYDEEEITRFARRLRHARYVEGYSSMIYEVARKVNQLGLAGGLELKMVMGTSEKIYESYQAEVLAAFGRRIISEYGAAETGLIAFECPAGSMHIVSEHVVVEVEEDGEILVTNLLSRSFPVIRYRLGDSVKLAPSDFVCGCGRSHPVILDVEGRIGKVIRGIEGTYPSLTLYYVFKNIAHSDHVELSYQAHQREKGKLILLIEQDRPEHASKIDREMRRYFGSDLVWEIAFGRTFERAGGKLRDFITTID
ncbi:MAG: phenylacetate--CoA ligase family protein [Myxococcota bacterium]